MGVFLLLGENAENFADDGSERGIDGRTEWHSSAASFMYQTLSLYFYYISYSLINSKESRKESLG